MNLKKPGVIAAIITATLLLTGCAGVDTFTGAEKPAPADTAAPTPSAPTFTVGQLVDADVVLPKGQTAYPLPDGTHMVVARAEPLPEVVQADLTARAAVVAQANNRVGGDTMDSVRDARGEFEAVVRSAGKRPLIIWEHFGFPTMNDETMRLMWSAPAIGEANYRQTTLEAMEAAVNDFLARNDDPGSFAVIWAK